MTVKLEVDTLLHELQIGEDFPDLLEDINYQPEIGCSTNGAYSPLSSGVGNYFLSSCGCKNQACTGGSNCTEKIPKSISTESKPEYSIPKSKIDMVIESEMEVCQSNTGNDNHDQDKMHRKEGTPTNLSPISKIAMVIQSEMEDCQSNIGNDNHGLVEMHRKNTTPANFT